MLCMRKKKLALVLSGGGFKGAFQVGALEYLLYNPVQIEDEVIDIQKFDIISGVSVGSLNGALVATNQMEALKDIWFNQIINSGPDVIYVSKYLENGRPSTKKIISDLIPDLNTYQKFGVFFSDKKREEFLQKIIDNFLDLEGFADNTPLLNILEKYIHLNKFEEVIYKMGFVSLRDGRYKSVSHSQMPDNDELRKAIIASSTIPVIWPPIPSIKTIDGDNFFDNVDGGIRNVSPLKDVIDEINKSPADERDYYIIVINCSNNLLPPIDPEPSLLEIASRSMLDITFAEIFKNDLDQFLWINDMLSAQNLKQLKIRNKVYRRYKIKIIQPEKSIGDTLDARPEIINASRKHGYEMAEKVTKIGDWNV